MDITSTGADVCHAANLHIWDALQINVMHWRDITSTSTSADVCHAINKRYGDALKLIVMMMGITSTMAYVTYDFWVKIMTRPSDRTVKEYYSVMGHRYCTNSQMNTI